MEQALLVWVERACGVLLIALTLACYLSLLTWSRWDPSLTNATVGDTHNLLGMPGAVVSDLALQMYGIAAVICLVAPLSWGLQLAMREGLPHPQLRLIQLLIGTTLLVGGLSALPVAADWPLEHGYGGFLGDVVQMVASGLASVLLGPVAGSFVAGLTTFVAGSCLVALALGFGARDVKRAWTSVSAVARSPVPARAGLSEPAQQGDGGSRANASPDDHRVAGRQTVHRSVNSVIALAWRTLSHRRGAPQAEPDRHGGSEPGSEAPARAHDFSEPQLSFGSYAAPSDAQGSQHVGGRCHEARADGSQVEGPSTHVRPAKRDAASSTELHDRAFIDQPGLNTPDDIETEALPRIFRRSAPADELGTGMRGLVEGVIPNFVRRQITSSARRDPRPTEQSREAQARFAADASSVGAVPHDAFQGSLELESSAVLSGAARPNASVHEAYRDPQAALAGAPSAAMGRRRTAPPPLVAPSLDLLVRSDKPRQTSDLGQTVLRGNACLLEDVLSDFGVKGTIREIAPGPVITRYELEIGRGIKASRVIGLSDDIARLMSASSARVAVIPGRNTLGIELPNVNRATVVLRDILESPAFADSRQSLPIALGAAIDGTPVIADLARMPHLLVAGTTGSGKSVGVNAMIVSLLYRHAPETLRFVMIDPKMLELSVYNGIPHLLTPVVTDPQKAVAALEWTVREMEERYKRMAEHGVRNIASYNARVRELRARGGDGSTRVQTGFDPETGEAIYEERAVELNEFPFIVVVVDEFADLMVVAGKEIEAAVQRLAQMARAAGIHLIMATQRPSVDIVTGTIKANFPTRVAFKVASKIDSRTILNEQGAEQLLGNGDMLYSNGSGAPTRVHGAFVSDAEVEAIADALRLQRSPCYIDGITDVSSDEQVFEEREPPGTAEDLYARAVAIVMRDQKATTSYIQRRLQIGYNRAANLIERMEREGLIGPANHTNKREILKTPSDQS